MRYWCSRRFASSWLTPSRTVISRSLVMSSATGWFGFVAKRTSRFVRIPTSLPRLPFGPRSTTGMPEMPWRFIRPSASLSVSSGKMVIGFRTMPDSNFFTSRTCSACGSGSRLRWMTPRPPFWAMAIAMRASVTVSIAEAMIGRLRAIERVSRVSTLTSAGRTSEWPGRNSTSSKVRPSMSRSAEMCGMANSWTALRPDEAAGAVSSWRGFVSRG